MAAHGAIIGAGLDGSSAVVRVTIGTAPHKLHGIKAYKARTAARAEVDISRDSGRTHSVVVNKSYIKGTVPPPPTVRVATSPHLPPT